MNVRIVILRTNSIAKGFDTAAPVSAFINKSLIEDYRDIKMRLTVNGEVRQEATCDLMIFDVPTLINFISKYFTLCPGDVILTGTPSGVGPVTVGDTLEAELWSGDKNFYIRMHNKVGVNSKL